MSQRIFELWRNFLKILERIPRGFLTDLQKQSQMDSPPIVPCRIPFFPEIISFLLEVTEKKNFWNHSKRNFRETLKEFFVDFRKSWKNLEKNSLKCQKESQNKISKEFLKECQIESFQVRNLRENFWKNLKRNFWRNLKKNLRWGSLKNHRRHSCKKPKIVFGETKKESQDKLLG